VAHSNKRTDKERDFTASPKRHATEFMSASEFKTYEAILRWVFGIKKIREAEGKWRQGEPLVFSKKVGHLAGMSGQSENTVSRNLKKFVLSGWLILIADQKHIRRHGNFTTNEYRVVLVDEWLKTRKYSPKPKKKNDKLRKVNTRRMLTAMGVTFADDPWAQGVLSMTADAYARAAVDQNTSPTVDQNTLPASITVDQDTSATVDQDTSTTDTQNTSTTDTQNTSTSVCPSPVSPPPPPSVREERWREFVHKTAPMMGVPTTDEKRQLRELAGREPHGLAFLAGAVEFEFQNRPKGTVGLRSMWATFIRENADADYVRSARTRLMASGEWRLANIPGERERQDASIARQTAELIEFRDRNRVPDEDWGVEDLMKDIEEGSGSKS
jgi:hypothetical protein